MRHLIVVDRFHDFDGFDVAGFAESVDCARVDVEAAGFVDEVDDGEAGEEGVRAGGGGVPEPGVDGEGAVGRVGRYGEEAFGKEGARGRMGC